MNEMITPATYIMAFDLGTTKIVGTVAQRHNDGSLTILAHQEEATKMNTIKKGEIFNVTDTEFVISKMVTMLRNVTKLNLTKAYISVGGRNLVCAGNTSKRALGNNEIVDQQLLDTLLEENYRLQKPEYKIIQVLPQEYLIDDETIDNPCGISCLQLEGRYKIIYIKNSIIDTINKINQTLKEKNNVELIGLLPAPIVIANALLSEDEKDLGCMVIDFGGGTTSFSIFKNNYMRMCGVIPIGAKNITNDIRELNLTENHAEKLKIQFGNALSSTEIPDRRIIISKASAEQEEKSVQSAILSQIIEARVTEIIGFIVNTFKTSAYLRQLGAGIVITGGGAKLKNIKPLLELLTGASVRIGVNKLNQVDESITVDFKDVSKSHIIGLLVLGTENCVSDEIANKKEKTKKVEKKDKAKPFATIFGGIGTLVDKTQDKLSGLFTDTSDKIE